MSDHLSEVSISLEAAEQHAREAIAIYVGSAVLSVEQAAGDALSIQNTFINEEQEKRDGLIEEARLIRSKKVGEFCTATTGMVQNEDPEIITLVGSLQTGLKSIAASADSEIDSHEQETRVRTSQKADENRSQSASKAFEIGTELSGKIESQSLQNLARSIETGMTRIQTMTNTQQTSLANLLLSRLTSLKNLINQKDIALTNEIDRLTKSLESELQRAATRRERAASSATKPETKTDGKIIIVPDSAWGKARPKRRK